MGPEEDISADEEWSLWLPVCVLWENDGASSMDLGLDDRVNGPAEVDPIDLFCVIVGFECGDLELVNVTVERLGFEFVFDETMSSVSVSLAFELD